MTSAHRNGLLVLLTLGACGYSFARPQARGNGKILEVTNSLKIARPETVVEISLSDVLAKTGIADPRHVAVEDQSSHQTLATQIYSSDGSGTADTLLVLVNLGPKQTIRLAFREALENSAAKALVYGRLVPERKDDFAWENEKVAYRVYGPALEATAEISSGIDVWSKRIPNFVVNSFYMQDHEAAVTHNPALSYHNDNGVGLDSYDVGPSLGCGGTAVWANGKLTVSKNYTFAKILAAGPVRFEFEVSYAPWRAAGRVVTETKRVTLDAGSHLNKIVSTLAFDGESPLDLAAGIAIHEGGVPTLPTGRSIAAVWDTPQKPSTGRIATGLVSLPAEQATTTTPANHALMIFKRHSGESFTYFAGSGWSKADMPTQEDWNMYLVRFEEMQEHPVASHWTKR